MTLIEIRRNVTMISDDTVREIMRLTGLVAARALNCDGGYDRKPPNIMFEVSEMSPLDWNSKDIHVRVWAHDFPARRGAYRANLKSIRQEIAKSVASHLDEGVTWDVRVLLAATSYGSDTEED